MLYKLMSSHSEYVYLVQQSQIAMATLGHLGSDNNLWQHHIGSIIDEVFFAKEA